MSLNRKTRRKLAKVHDTSEAIKKAVVHEHVLATDYAVRAYTVAAAMHLWDKLAKDKDELRMHMADIQKLFEELTEERLSIEDCERTLFDEADFKIE